jgi:hypothetical protein
MQERLYSRDIVRALGLETFRKSQEVVDYVLNSALVDNQTLAPHCSRGEASLRLLRRYVHSDDRGLVLDVEGFGLVKSFLNKGAFLEFRRLLPKKTRIQIDSRESLVFGSNYWNARRDSAGVMPNSQVAKYLARYSNMQGA